MKTKSHRGSVSEGPEIYHSIIIRPRYGVCPLGVAASAACVCSRRPTIHLGCDPTLPFTAVACLRQSGLDWRSFRLESLTLIECLVTAGRGNRAIDFVHLIAAVESPVHRQKSNHLQYGILDERDNRIVR